MEQNEISYLDIEEWVQNNYVFTIVETDEPIQQSNHEDNFIAFLNQFIFAIVQLWKIAI